LRHIKLMARNVAAGPLSLPSVPAEPDSHQWYVKGGIRRKWTKLGATILYGEYTQYVDQMGPAALNAGVTSSEFTRWGFCAVQVDSAAMSLFITYRQHDGELDGGTFAGNLGSGAQTKLQTNRAAQHGTGYHKPGSSEQKWRTGAHA
jgi:hypothetical protein